MAVVQKGDIGIFVPPIILTGILCVLTILEPDLGSTALLALVMAIIFFVAGIRLRYIAGVAIVSAVALYVLILMKPYRMSRMQAYLNPWQDPQGSGFQIIQSFLAFALGGLKGVGLGESTQKLFYLPSSHNDFILAVIAEEMGLLGVLFVTALYVVFFICCIRMAKRTDQPFEKILITALMLVIILQTLIHMMVATGLVPTKGLPLPLVSYGGSSIVLNLITVGVLMSVDRRRPSRGQLK